MEQNHTKAVGTREDLLTTVKGRKFDWYGHVSWACCENNTTRNRPQGKRKRGRQRKEWGDNITEWIEIKGAE